MVEWRVGRYSIHTLLIWYLEGNALLEANAKAILDDHLTELILPIITLCEAVHVINKGRTKSKRMQEANRCST